MACLADLALSLRNSVEIGFDSPVGYLTNGEQLRGQFTATDSDWSNGSVVMLVLQAVC
jgi:hypothetical protein